MTTEDERRAVSALSEGLGPNATLLDHLRSTAHWQLTEGNGDDATHQALHAAIAEIVRLSAFAQDVADNAFTQHQDYWAAQARQVLGPNVRAKRATTAGRQARAGETVPRTARPGLVACRWRSA